VEGFDIARIMCLIVEEARRDDFLHMIVTTTIDLRWLSLLSKNEATRHGCAYYTGNRYYTFGNEDYAQEAYKTLSEGAYVVDTDRTEAIIDFDTEQLYCLIIMTETGGTHLEFDTVTPAKRRERFEQIANPSDDNWATAWMSEDGTVHVDSHDFVLAYMAYDTIVGWIKQQSKD
jgi:hypothetical protein